MYTFMPRYDKYPTFTFDGETLIDILNDNCQVVIIRDTTFFYVTQKTNLAALKKQYTNKAIVALETDGFIKIEKSSNK